MKYYIPAIAILIIVMYSCNFFEKKEIETDTTTDTIAEIDSALTQEMPEKKTHNKLTYDFSIDELMEINIIDSTNVEYEPSYELSIKDLMEMKIVKELRLDTSLQASYDVPLEDLMTIEIPLHKRDESKIRPNYEMSLQGLLEWEIEEEYKVIDRVELTYEISLDGLMEIKIKDLEKNK